MSYQNGTTHYNLPLTVSSDRRDWADTNQAFQDVDAALHGAVTDVATAGANATEALTKVNVADATITQIQSDIATLQASDTTQDTTLLQHGQAITALQAADTALGTRVTTLEGKQTITRIVLNATSGETAASLLNRLYTAFAAEALPNDVDVRIILEEGEGVETEFPLSVRNNTMGVIYFSRSTASDAHVDISTIKLANNASTIGFGRITYTGTGSSYNDTSTSTVYTTAELVAIEYN